MVYLYAGNYMTGEVMKVIVENDDDAITNAVWDLSESLGFDHVVWVLYNMAQSMEVRDIQFNNYLANCMGHYDPEDYGNDCGEFDTEDVGYCA